MATSPNAGFQIPDHVPPELIHHVGIPEAPTFLADPYAFFKKLATEYPPIFYSVGSHGGSWHLLKHADAFRMLRDAEYFSNEGGTPFPRDPNDPFKFIPIEIDPPEHRKYRAILDPIFSPQGIVALEGTIRKLANDLIDEVIDKGECEFTTAYGRPLPVAIFLDLMGLPQAMRDTFVDWAVGLLHSSTREGMAAAFNQIVAYIKQAIAEKRANPDDKVVSRIVHGEIDGRQMSEKESFGFVLFLFIAGLDTVFATMNNMWLWLAENPSRRHEIISRPDDMNAITEEMLRAAEHPVREDEVTIPEIRLVCANFYLTEFPPGAFDLIYSLGMFGNGCPVTTAVCNRFHKWLAPGGKLFFNTVDVAGMPASYRIKRQIRGVAYPFLPPKTKARLDERAARHPFYGMSRRELASVLKQSQFKNFEVTSNFCESPLWNGRHLECIASKD